MLHSAAMQSLPEMNSTIRLLVLIEGMHEKYQVRDIVLIT